MSGDTVDAVPLPSCERRTNRRVRGRVEIETAILSWVRYVAIVADIVDGPGVTVRCGC